MMNMTSLQKPVAGLLTAVFLASALSGCGESDFDKARKPELIERAVATSLERCDTQDKKPQEIPYEARLRLALEKADSVALDKLEENGIAVCLDQRLPHVKTDFFDTRIRGIFYAEAKIVSLWDNGRNPETQSWYETNILYRAGESIENLADEVLGTPDAAKMQIGSTYGKGQHWDWRDASRFSDELTKNPHLKVPPAPPSVPLLQASLN
ncbi:MAG: hypothetical protein HYS17_04105 [Micavibrio aeruginosavorus]|uniref:Uncharacterized protein n=1 Tax=Micavibrio aeruginosavorus TaxID=349221 RepID=A0A7T5R3P3_9BACT|nr:MAG: hypothetical protein HYS17_04105 [Micavibrio aeruginosavorus]